MVEEPKEIRDFQIRKRGDLGPRKFEVLEEYTILWNGYILVIPKGFIYDLSSVPRPFRNIVDAVDLSAIASAAHDLLYRSKGILPDHISNHVWTRHEADYLYYELNVWDYIDEDVARIGYIGVRFGGWNTWRKGGLKKRNLLTGEELKEAA